MAITNPVKAIRAKCLDCCCGSSAEVKLCSCEDCSLHPFRFGKNPYRTRREYTAEEREVMKARLSQVRPNTAGKEMILSTAKGNDIPALSAAKNRTGSGEIFART